MIARESNATTTTSYPNNMPIVNMAEREPKGPSFYDNLSAIDKNLYAVQDILSAIEKTIFSESMDTIDRMDDDTCMLDTLERQSALSELLVEKADRVLKVLS